MFFWFILAGLLSGVIAGMGMGGGTILIPLLNIFYSVSQHTAQAINLVSFIPMACIALYIHLKNKLIDFNKILYVIIPAVLLSVGGSFLMKGIDGDLLKKLFGGFLILLAIFQCIMQIFSKKNND